MEKLKQKLKKDYNVDLEVKNLGTTVTPPTVTLSFNLDKSIIIYHKLNTNGLSYYRTEAEMIAKMKNWIQPIHVIKSISTINTSPYKIEICAIEPLIYSFVLALLEN